MKWRLKINFYKSNFKKVWQMAFQNLKYRKIETFMTPCENYISNTWWVVCRYTCNFILDHFSLFKHNKSNVKAWNEKITAISYKMFLLFTFTLYLPIFTHPLSVIKRLETFRSLIFLFFKKKRRRKQLIFFEEKKILGKKKS